MVTQEFFYIFLPIAKTINVFEPVDWLAGDQIMITTTYGFFNYTVSLGDPMTSNEVRTVSYCLFI